MAPSTLGRHSDCHSHVSSGQPHFRNYRMSSFSIYNWKQQKCNGMVISRLVLVPIKPGHRRTLERNKQAHGKTTSRFRYNSTTESKMEWTDHAIRACSWSGLWQRSTLPAAAETWPWRRPWRHLPRGSWAGRLGKRQREPWCVEGPEPDADAPTETETDRAVWAPLPSLVYRIATNFLVRSDSASRSFPFFFSWPCLVQKNLQNWHCSIFVCIWQKLSNYGLTRLKIFVSSISTKLCN